jgi:hypothetical protein
VKVADLETATVLCDRLRRSHPEWTGNLQVNKSGNLPIITLLLPHCPEHEFSIEVQRTEATVAYSDGLAPGPAEQLFVWGNAPLEECLAAVCEYICSLLRGDIILVREQISGVVQFLRRHDCDSLLWFVPSDDFKRWSRRRRRRVQRAWSWDGTSKLAI